MSTRKHSSSSNSTGRRSSPAGGRSHSKTGPGLFGGKEKKILILAARQAYDYQAHLDNLDPGETFDTWRHAQVMQITGKHGLTACHHHDFRPLLAHFQLLAGHDDKALATNLKSGRIFGKGAPDDTHENRETLAREICLVLESHIELHDLSWPEYLDLWTRRSKAEWATYQGGDTLPWPGLPSKEVTKAMNRKIAMAENGGPLRHGYLVTLAQGKTRRPDLSLGNDLQKGLAERCTVKQLRDLLATLVNRINAREGLENKGRNAGQKSESAKARRRRTELAPDRPQDTVQTDSIPAPAPDPETARAESLFAGLLQSRRSGPA